MLAGSASLEAISHDIGSFFFSPFTN